MNELTPYQLLFDVDDRPGPGLPAAIQALYGGDWRLPAPPTQRPYCFTNFVVSHDGRIGFDEPGYSGGPDISRGAPHDLWLMALIRSRADAILTGTGTLRSAGNHRWLPWETFPAARAALTALRTAEGRAPLPALVILTASGQLPPDAAALHVPNRPLIIATTAQGATQAQRLLADHPAIHYHISPGPQVDLLALATALRQQYGITTLLSEGGARVYGTLLAAALLDEVFTTHSPVVVGNRQPPAPPRPSLVEGVAFDPGAPPRLRLLSLRRVGDYLFQRAMLLPASA
ncbi:MAG: RibD family protein [Oscillochloridaceae bacterium umkhey_bin13]